MAYFLLSEEGSIREGVTEALFYLSSSFSSSSYILQRALEPIAKMNLCVWLARMPMKATGFAVGVSRARP